jgi:hypothetical protein
VQVGVLGGHVHRRADGAALGVAQHHDQRRAQVLDGVDDRAQALLADGRAGHADHEQFAQIAVEDQFGPTRLSLQPTITANGFWPLDSSAIRATVGRAMLAPPRAKMALPCLRRPSASSGLTAGAGAPRPARPRWDLPAA